MKLHFTREWLQRKIAADPDVDIGAGWLCPNCKRAHSPSIRTCPVDNRSLRERLKGEIS